VLLVGKAPVVSQTGRSILHTQDETARALVLEHGADYLLTVKGNQPTVREQIETLVAVPQGDFPPS
jgi:hypothetical protein